MDPLLLSIISFGRANGPLNPIGSEAVEQLRFSVRDVENPPARLRKTHTGVSARLRKEIFGNQAARRRLDTMLQVVEAKMIEFSKAHIQAEHTVEGLRSLLPVCPTLLIGIMCEQGKHRSVAFAEELGRKITPRDGWTVSVEHRDLGVFLTNAENEDFDERTANTKALRRSKRQREQERKQGRSFAGEGFEDDTFGDEEMQPNMPQDKTERYRFLRDLLGASTVEIYNFQSYVSVRVSSHSHQAGLSTLQDFGIQVKHYCYKYLVAQTQEISKEAYIIYTVEIEPNIQSTTYQSHAPPPTMFYEPGKTDHNLPHDPFKACVIPRPIGWISTINPQSESNTQPTNSTNKGNSNDIDNSIGQANLAPFSQFNNLTFDPPYIMFSSNQTPSRQQKDTVRNIEATGVFCWQLATYALREAVNVTAEQVPYGVDEFERAGLEKEYSTVLATAVPMVKASPIKFECEYYTTLRLPGNPPMGSADVVVGKVVGIHIDEGVLTDDGKIDVTKTQPIARCGYYDYAVVKETFQMIVPGGTTDTLYGLEGNVRKHNAAREAGRRMGVSAEDEQGPP
ncbi:hypothetical protein CLCR_04576 [Cladophialophora carrionii]|uniref:Flavin reductase like domain-containing protein n=1 Tax=Cladophialophora carrionii TaxID=86049 RepID=A0A1C1CJM0_9EURO|nr:hypothetical protein CLCR_04576 [Cladophialophora carrionii]